MIVLDIQLPGMDGYAMARALKQNPALKDVPIVAVTSYAMTGDRERCLDSGMDGYISKPIRAKDLLELIWQYSSQAAAATRDAE